MSSPTTLTYDLVPPRRPGIDDVGGCAKENDTNYPPNPQTMATAEDFNQMGRLDVAHAKVVEVAKLSVHFTGGTPFVAKATGPGSAIVTTLFTVTDNGVGDTSITWPAGTLPTAVIDPDATVTGATPALIACEAITNGVRVRTKSDAGAAIDVPFNVRVS